MFLEWSLVSRRFAVALTFVLGGGMLLAANLVPLKGVVKMPQENRWPALR